MLVVPSSYRLRLSTCPSLKKVESSFFNSLLCDQSTLKLNITRYGRLQIAKRVSAVAMSLTSVTSNLPVPFPRLLLVSDLDNTMVDHKDKLNSSLLRFNALWTTEYAFNSILVYSTGRSPTSFLDLKKHVPLMTPDITILSVGTEILYGEDMVPDNGWEQILDQGWDREAVVKEASQFSQLKWQQESEQRPHKVSFNIEKKEAADVIDKLQSRFKELDLQVKIIYSGGHDLDLLPMAAGKGQALAYLMRNLSSMDRSPANTLACGDSGNDQELFEVQGANGVIVGNAMEELVQWYKQQEDTAHLFYASERCAAGILEAIAHFKFNSSSSPRDSLALGLEVSKEASGGVAAVQREITSVYLLLERWLNGGLQEDEIFDAFSGKVDGFTLVAAGGVESRGGKFPVKLHRRIAVNEGWMVWIDRIQCSILAPGLYLARYRVCEQLSGGDRIVKVSSAILKEKDPRGLNWVHLHESVVE